MEIILSSQSGFCSGVKRAINLSLKAAKNKQKVYTFGPLIHNPEEIKRLEKNGIKNINSLNSVTEGKIIIPAHGITHQDKEKIKNKGLEIIDATCPLVKENLTLVTDCIEENYYVIIVGEKNHQEIKSLCSYLPKNKFLVVETKKDLKKLKFHRKVAIVVQTTQTLENFREIVSLVLDDAKEFKIYNTICKETIARQEEAKRIARQVDVVLVVGGKNSANTHRLYDTCQKITKSFLIESANDLEKKMLENIKKVGIVSGTSTPFSSIQEIIRKLEVINNG